VIDWLWTTIEETVDLYNNDTKEFSKRGGEQFFDAQQRRAILKIPVVTSWLIYGVKKNSSYGGFDCV
jgi:hypothetical protein